MSFSAVTCLTYTGTTTLGGVLNLYSDVDSFTTAFQTNVNLSAITGNQCPYNINNVPDGTSQIRVFDIGTGCYCDIPIQSNNLCTTCNLDFNSYSASTVGRLVAGRITGSCDSNITDYRIYWYETGNTTTPAYISGFGTAYTPYNFTHPLTGNTAIFAQEGTYKPIIDKIKLSGLTFSQTGGTGFIPAELECFDTTTVTVNPFTCSNGTTSNDPRYKHRVNFLSASNGVPPVSLDSTFLLTGTTNYFAWRFCGFDVPDRLRMFYSGSAYQSELLLEDIVMGRNLTNSDFTINTLPKSASTRNTGDYIKKVTCLTGLTRNPGDKIILQVIPNTLNPQTNWDYYFTCLDTMESNPCGLTFPSYQIVFSSITYNPGNCNRPFVSFQISGCPYQADNFSKYVLSDGSSNSITNSDYRTEFYSPHGVSYSFLLSGSTSNTYVLQGNQTKFCENPSTNIITYKKYISGGTGVIDMEFNNINDFNTYYLNYSSINSSSTSGLYGFPCASASGSYSGTPFDNTDIRYYRYYELRIPNNTGTTFCGDGTTERIYHIHPSTVVTTGFTSPNYTLRFTMPITNLGISLTGCSNSGLTATARGVVNVMNTSSTGITNNFTGTTLTGSKFIVPFAVIGMCAATGVTQTFVETTRRYFAVPKYLNETIVFSGNPYVIAPSLSAQTFNFNTSAFTLNSYVNTSLNAYVRYTYQYAVQLTNPNVDSRDFSISARTQTTGGSNGPYTLIYSYTGVTSAGTVHNPSYFVL